MQQQTKISLSIIIVAILIGGALLLGGSTSLTTSGKNQITTQQNANTNTNIREENGVQIIKILARGGYNPRKIMAQANKPLKIEMETKGTYDCSSAFVIPALKYQKQLPATGITTIDIPAQPADSTIQGLCAMGMYSFTVEFK